MKKFIPDFLTCLNLFCGCLGLHFVFNDGLAAASFMLILSMLFDFFDGMAARLLKASSGIGKDLDSLADVVSFGVVPSMILYSMMKNSIGHSELELSSGFTLFYLLIPFLVTIFSALRLAKFNSDPRQVDSFIGLPTPASALFILSLPLINFYSNDAVASIIIEPITLALVSIVLAFLMVSPIPMFSLKFKNFGLLQNKLRYFFLVTCILLLILLQFLAIPCIIAFYVLLSILTNLGQNKEEFKLNN